MRVLPRWESIKDIEGVMPCEDVREIVKQRPIAILGCPCKKIERHRDCKDEVPLETCIVFSRSAQHNLNRGSARELTQDEVMDIIKELDKHQLVHMTGNSNALPPLLCNCHACCCGALMRNAMTMAELNQFSIMPSRFISVEDPEACNGCRTCADVRCPVGAIEMKFHPELNEERAHTNPDTCIGCGLCVITCPTGARSMKLVRPPEHIPKPGGRPEEYATY
jgi:ferredoxin